MRNDRRVVLMVEDDNKLREVLTKFLSETIMKFWRQKTEK